MEKVECKACSATVDKSIEFCSSCGEWLGLSIKDIENADAKTEPEVTRRVRPPEECCHNHSQIMGQLLYQQEMRSLESELFFF